MAQLRHPEHGTEIEVEDGTVDSLEAEGWTVAGSDGDTQDDEPKRRKSTRKDG